MAVLAAFPELFIELCRKAAAAYQNRHTNGYGATENQVLFFTAAVNRTPSRQRQGSDRPARACPDGQRADPSTIAATAHDVAAQLDGLSGEVVTGLKVGLHEPEHIAWRAFLRQLGPIQQRLARQFDQQLDRPTQEDALAKGLSKLLKLLQTMPDGAAIDGTADLYAFTQAYLQRGGALYNFRKPFWGYVFRMLYNECLHAVRQHKTNTKRFRTLEEALDLYSPEHTGFAEEEAGEAAFQEQIAQLRALLPQLIAAIAALPQKRRLVAAYTLAGRSQFWLALQLAAITAPTWYPTPERFTTDQQIAQQLAMTDNSVRANRRYGYQDIAKVSPALGRLYLTLIDVHF